MVTLLQKNVKFVHLNAWNVLVEHLLNVIIVQVLISFIVLILLV